MGLVYLGLLCTASIGVVLGLIQYYRNKRTVGLPVLLIVFLGFLFPLSITFLLPIDVSSARFNWCIVLGGSKEYCQKPALYVRPKYLDYIWLISYWNSFLLTWIVVPFIQGYTDTGEFGTVAKLLDSLKMNFIYYGAMTVGLVILTIYLVLNTSMTTLESAIGFVMSLGNVWGLLIVMIFLGHGLIQLPRALWKSANHRRSLIRLEMMAPKTKEQLVEAQADLDQVIAEIQSLHRRPVVDASLNLLVDELLNNTPLPEIDFINGFANQTIGQPHSPSTPITRKYLVKLNYRAKEAVAHRDSSESKWNSLVEKFIHIQDQLANERCQWGRLWTSSLEAPSKHRWIRFLQWLWYVKLKSFSRRLLSISAVLASFLIVWSEASILYQEKDLSPISWLIHKQSLSPTTVELLTLALLLYLATCTYSSFMKVRIFRYYLLVPHHTDEKSLLFFAAYLCRISFPLGYNYLQLIQKSTGTGEKYLKTEFSRVMGPMNLIPVMGRSFNFYFSIGLVLVCILVMLRWHGWLAELFSPDLNLSFADYSDDREEHLIEGRELLLAARRQIDRSRNRSNDFSRTYPWNRAGRLSISNAEIA